MLTLKAIAIGFAIITLIFGTLFAIAMFVNSFSGDTQLQILTGFFYLVTSFLVLGVSYSIGMVYLESKRLKK